jgi:hypothetical protein
LNLKPVFLPKGFVTRFELATNAFAIEPSDQAEGLIGKSVFGQLDSFESETVRLCLGLPHVEAALVNTPASECGRSEWVS